jgi:multiple sugar transport system permease protein
VLPAGAIAIPLFAQFIALGLIDTPFVLILLYTGAILPFAVWTLMSFISELPRDMEEAAWVDGASTVQALWYVVRPVIAPAVVATGVIAYIFAFNEFFFALVFTRIEWLTFPVQTASLIGTGGIAWGPITAAGVIGLVPPLITLILAQRFLVRGLSVGAVK